ncbi:MAG TPA: glycosyltransferase family 4 protein [Solirubrobacteraceae bacterium]|jgi:glycosyltransferase involved in cell wall biosynthesis
MARVALVCEPPDGGVAEHVALLALGLAERGYEPLVFGPPDFALRARLAGRFRALPLGREYGRPDRDAAAAAALARALRATGCDLVHAHAAKAGVLGRLAAVAAGAPAVYTPHCLPFVGEVSAARRRFGLFAERSLAPLTAALVCVCEQERRVALAARLRPRRLVVVHNGCPAPDPRQVTDPALRELKRRGPLVGAVSVLRRQKAVDVLLDAMPALRARVPDARVAIVGDGPERAALLSRAAPLGDAVAFLPFTPPAARHLLELDVYVLPSAWEAFPIGVLEAQACGIPQVATDVGGTREAVVPDTGVLVPPRDPGALAAALAELLLDPGRRARLAAASLARHAERFSVERMLDGTAAVYDAVLRAPAAAARRRAAPPAGR